MYVFLADGFEEIEAITVIDILRRAKLEVCTVSIGDELSVTGSHGIQIMADRLLSQMPIDTSIVPQALILPGGMPGSTNLLESDRLKEFFCAHRDLSVIAAICAAPMVLGEWRLLEGKKATCFPGFEEHLYGAALSLEAVVQDGRYFTSRGAGTAAAFAFALVSYFKDQETADKLKNAMLY